VGSCSVICADPAWSSSDATIRDSGRVEIVRSGSWLYDWVAPQPVDIVGLDYDYWYESWRDPTRYANRQAVIQAVTDLDHAVGRQRRLGREPLDRSLGLGL
jgi:hypothetical protein